MCRERKQSFPLQLLWRLNKITYFKYGIVPGNKECNLSSFIMNNVIFIIRLRFSVDPYLLISRSSISLLIWLKPLLKFGVIIRSWQMGQLRLREFTWWSPKSDRSGRGPQTSYLDFKFQGSWYGHAVMFIANSCALVLENVGKKKKKRKFAPHKNTTQYLLGPPHHFQKLISQGSPILWLAIQDYIELSSTYS